MADQQTKTLRYRTKHQRMIAITDAYMKVFGVTMFTSQEVAIWAIARKLWPVPKRGDSEKVCSAWERRLERAR